MQFDPEEQRHCLSLLYLNGPQKTQEVHHAPEISQNMSHVQNSAVEGPLGQVGDEVPDILSCSEAFLRKGFKGWLGQAMLVMQDWQCSSACLEILSAGRAKLAAVVDT